MSDDQPKSDRDFAGVLERARKNVIEALGYIERTQNESLEDAKAVGVLRRMELHLGEMREDLFNGRWEGRMLVGDRPAE